jgi:hypothetical protein
MLAVVCLAAGCGRQASARKPSPRYGESNQTTESTANATTPYETPNALPASSKGDAANAQRATVTAFPETKEAVQRKADDNKDGSIPAVETPENPQPVFRRSDARQKHDAARLEQLGIGTFESKRLRLHSDIDPQAAASLPKIIDAVYDAWVEYFGPLPPNREGTEYQMTGYLMKDRELFRRAGLLPEDLPQFFHGRHRGAEFWLNEQEFEYYRRHLLIHEATHCFMTTDPDVQAPAWYMEGMAELFGTHRMDEKGTIRFRVMPDAEENFLGFGRIRMVRADVSAGRLLSFNAVHRLRPEEFVENSNYGWSWALCKFLDTHLRYRERFRTLGRYTTGTQFETKLAELFHNDLADLHNEWILFAANLQFSHDFERSVIAFREGKPIAEAGAAVRVDVAADKGWQSSGVMLEKGTLYDIAASGQFTLADVPVPWNSEPEGVSIFYSEGRPIGQLLATIRIQASPSDSPANTAEQQTKSMLEAIPVGRHARFASPVTGTLYFRVNDFWRSLEDNKGTVKVEVRAVQPAQP